MIMSKIRKDTCCDNYLKSTWKNFSFKFLMRSNRILELSTTSNKEILSNSFRHFETN